MAHLLKYKKKNGESGSKIRGFITSELRVTSYELPFIARVRSYFLYTSNKLLFITQVTSYFSHASCELLVIARVPGCSVIHFYSLLFTKSSIPRPLFLVTRAIIVTRNSCNKQ